MNKRIFSIHLLQPSFNKLRVLIGVKNRQNKDRFFNHNIQNQKGEFFKWISSDSIKKSYLKSLRRIEYGFFGMLQLTQKILPQRFTDFFVIPERYSNICLGRTGIANRPRHYSFSIFEIISSQVLKDILPASNKSNLLFSSASCSGVRSSAV